MKDDIVQGLKMALIKGESLQQAMQSFYNSGYDRKDIEDAAREVQGSQDQLSQEAKIFNQPTADPKAPQTPQPNLPQKSPQVVSNYEQPKKDHSTLMLIMIVLVLLLIVGAALAGVYFYREQVINFFSGLFG